MFGVCLTAATVAVTLEKPTFSHAFIATGILNADKKQSEQRSSEGSKTQTACVTCWDCT